MKIRIKILLVAAAVPWLLAGGASAPSAETIVPALHKNIRKAFIDRGYDSPAPKLKWIGRRVKLVEKYAKAAGLDDSIDEIIPLPTERANTMTIESQTFFRRPEEVGLDLEFLVARGRLNPVLDGALMPGDKKLVHLIWKITYKFDEVEASDCETRATTHGFAGGICHGR